MAQNSGCSCHTANPPHHLSIDSTADYGDLDLDVLTKAHWTGNTCNTCNLGTKAASDLWTAEAVLERDAWPYVCQNGVYAEDQDECAKCTFIADQPDAEYVEGWTGPYCNHRYALVQIRLGFEYSDVEHKNF